MHETQEEAGHQRQSRETDKTLNLTDTKGEY